MKETYTREEADFMSIISAAMGANPHTFQGDSAWWANLEVDFKDKTVRYQVFGDEDPKLYYLVAGISVVHKWAFEEIL